MITEKDTIKCESIFNDDRTHRFLWRRVWDKDKPVITVIMLNPCLSDNIITDTTTSIVVNNVAKLGEYGGVEIVNLYSKLTSKLKLTESDEELNEEENDSYILKSVEASSKTIIAWGKSSSSNATALIQAGVSPKVVQQRLGHSDVTITLNTYTHVLPEMYMEAAEKLDDIIFKRA